MKSSNNAFSIIKKIGFVLLIVLVFTPLSFLVSNTIISNMYGETEECYLKEYRYPVKDRVNWSPEEVAEEEVRQEEIEACNERNEILRKKLDTANFIIITIINVIVIFGLLVIGTKIDDIISYSMFFSAGLNTIIVVMRNTMIKSYLGIGLGVLLFGLIIVYINRNLKKQKK